jgi:RNA recognition motif-containing protein
VLQDFVTGQLHGLSKLRKIRRVTIAKKKDMKHAGKLLSLGYGFVEFETREDALDTLKSLNVRIRIDLHRIFSVQKQKKEGNSHDLGEIIRRTCGTAVMEPKDGSSRVDKQQAQVTIFTRRHFY